MGHVNSQSSGSINPGPDGDGREGAMSMTSLDYAGYVASAPVALTFYMMVHLRIAALCSNVVFLVYGIGLGLGPVALLHGVPIPLNLS
jgi:hypothetical protein